MNLESVRSSVAGNGSRIHRLCCVYDPTIARLLDSYALPQHFPSTSPLLRGHRYHTAVKGLGMEGTAYEAYMWGLNASLKL